MLSPCGIYCSVICPIYTADKGNHPRLKEVLADEMKVAPEDIRCEGCLSENPFVQCQSCTVRDCIISRDNEGCYVCDDFPCQVIEGMSDEVGRKAILRAVPLIRELGLERFPEEITKYYRCPHCGYQLFMGARKCHSCKRPVDID